jgi:hypothetical protein
MKGVGIPKEELEEEENKLTSEQEEMLRLARSVVCGDRRK